MYAIINLVAILAGRAIFSSGRGTPRPYQTRRLGGSARYGVGTSP
jgi:hypothetical protein